MAFEARTFRRLSRYKFKLNSENGEPSNNQPPKNLTEIIMAAWDAYSDYSQAINIWTWLLSLISNTSFNKKRNELAKKNGDLRDEIIRNINFCVDTAADKNTDIQEGHSTPKKARGFSRFLKEINYFPSGTKTVAVIFFTLLMLGIALTGVGALLQLGIVGSGFLTALFTAQVVVNTTYISLTLSALTVALSSVAAIMLTSLLFNEWLRPGYLMRFVPFVGRHATQVDVKHSLREIWNKTLLSQEIYEHDYNTKGQEQIKLSSENLLRFIFNPLRWIEASLELTQGVVFRTLEIGATRKSKSPFLRAALKQILGEGILGLVLAPISFFKYIIDIPFYVVKAVVYDLPLTLYKTCFGDFSPRRNGSGVAPKMLRDLKNHDARVAESASRSVASEVDPAAGVGFIPYSNQGSEQSEVLRAPTPPPRSKPAAALNLPMADAPQPVSGSLPSTVAAAPQISDMPPPVPPRSDINSSAANNLRAEAAVSTKENVSPPEHVPSEPKPAARKLPTPPSRQDDQLVPKHIASPVAIPADAPQVENKSAPVHSASQQVLEKPAAPAPVKLPGLGVVTLKSAPKSENKPVAPPQETEAQAKLRKRQEAIEAAERAVEEEKRRQEELKAAAERRLKEEAARARAEREEEERKNEQVRQQAEEARRRAEEDKKAESKRKHASLAAKYDPKKQGSSNKNITDLIKERAKEMERQKQEAKEIAVAKPAASVTSVNSGQTAAPAGGLKDAFDMMRDKLPPPPESLESSVNWGTGSTNLGAAPALPEQPLPEKKEEAKENTSTNVASGSKSESSNVVVDGEKDREQKLAALPGLLAGIIATKPIAPPLPKLPSVVVTDKEATANPPKCQYLSAQDLDYLKQRARVSNYSEPNSEAPSMTNSYLGDPNSQPVQPPAGSSVQAQAGSTELQIDDFVDLGKKDKGNNNRSYNP